MENTLKITKALGDPTRLSIYQYMSQHKKAVSVQDIADEFNIHPNVARLHLSKLNEVEVVTSSIQRTGSGGRPGRMYRVSEEGVELSFPRRDYQLLANMSLEALELFGDEGKKALIRVANERGKTLVKKRIMGYNKRKDALSFDDKINILSSVTSLIGYFPMIKEEDGEAKITFNIYNCPFYESMQEHLFICDAHNAYLKGAFETLFNIDTFQQNQKMMNGCQNCIYHVIVTNNK